MKNHFTTIDVTTPKPGILSVALNRPDVRNAFNEVMIRELTDVFSSPEIHNHEVRVILLRGNGKSFSAGGDLNWMKRSIHLPYKENLDDTRALSKMFRLMNECPVPLIAGIHDFAIGGGVGLISVCDHVIADGETKLSLSEVRLGLVPSCIAPFVIAKIGASQARSLFVSGERIDAHEAHRIGLVHKITTTGIDGVIKELNRMSEIMLQNGPIAVKTVKDLVLTLSWPERRLHVPDPYEYVSESLSKVRISDEAQEGFSAFLEKRKPKWKN